MNMTRCAWWISGLLLAGTAAAPGQGLKDEFFFEAGKTRVLILSGRNNHDWRASTAHLRRILEATGRFDVRVTEEPAGLTAETLRPYDVLVSDYCGPRWGAQAEEAVAAFVREGKGLVAVHAASYPFGVMPVLTAKMGRSEVYEKPWAEWEKMLGARWQDGDAAKGEKRTGHSRRHVFEVEWTETAHPVAAGLPAKFKVSDELYSRFVLSPSIRILARAFDDPAVNGTGQREAILWTNEYGRGRVFHTALGHDVAAMMAQGFVDSFARGVEWAATGKVTIPPELALEPKDKNAVRALLVVGGHDHDASLYRVFEGSRDLRVNVNPHPVAYRGDLRKRYDVVVMYDMVQELPEDQRKNLRAYAEAGGGIVVLHHALANFQDWDWWREMAGGLYLLKDREGLGKGSTYKHDVDLEARPAADHPVVRGLTPMWIRDETYKGVWQAPGILPLLTTSETTSNEVIGWISPYKAARVVVIQLGHGREAHENPWFQRLLRNAMLWASGRLK